MSQVAFEALGRLRGVLGVTRTSRSNLSRTMGKDNGVEGATTWNSDESTLEMYKQALTRTRSRKAVGVR